MTNFPAITKGWIQCFIAKYPVLKVCFNCRTTNYSCRGAVWFGCGPFNTDKASAVIRSLSLDGLPPSRIPTWNGRAAPVSLTFISWSTWCPTGPHLPPTPSSDNPPSRKESFYGHEDIARFNAPFITHLFSINQIPSQNESFYGHEDVAHLDASFITHRLLLLLSAFPISRGPSQFRSHIVRPLHHWYTHLQASTYPTISSTDVEAVFLHGPD